MLHTLNSSQRYVLFSTWSGAIDRCHNPANKSFSDYGGRGIVVCDRWLHSFDAFARDMGARPAERSLDRRDVNGPYSPDNCRWATRHEQARNTRRNKMDDVQVRRMLTDHYTDGVSSSTLALIYPMTRQNIDRVLAGQRLRLADFDYPQTRRDGRASVRVVTTAQARQVRAAHAAGASADILAARHGVARRTVYNVLNGVKGWQHLDLPDAQAAVLDEIG